MYGCKYSQYYELNKQDQENFNCTEEASSGSPLFSAFYFLSFVIFASFIIMNLTIGVVTSCLNRAIEKVSTAFLPLMAPVCIQQHFCNWQIEAEEEGEKQEKDRKDDKDITNTQVELSVLKLVDDMKQCRAEMEDIREMLAEVLTAQNAEYYGGTPSATPR